MTLLPSLCVPQTSRICLVRPFAVKALRSSVSITQVRWRAHRDAGLLRTMRAAQ